MRKSKAFLAVVFTCGLIISASPMTTNAASKTLTITNKMVKKGKVIVPKGTYSSITIKNSVKDAKIYIKNGVKVQKAVNLDANAAYKVYFQSGTNIKNIAVKNVTKTTSSKYPTIYVESGSKVGMVTTSKSVKVQEVGSGDVSKIFVKPENKKEKITVTVRNTKANMEVTGGTGKASVSVNVSNSIIGSAIISGGSNAGTVSFYDKSNESKIENSRINSVVVNTKANVNVGVDTRSATVKKLAKTAKVNVSNQAVVTKVNAQASNFAVTVNKGSKVSTIVTSGSSTAVTGKSGSTISTIIASGKNSTVSVGSKNKVSSITTSGAQSRISLGASASVTKSLSVKGTQSVVTVNENATVSNLLLSGSKETLSTKKGAVVSKLTVSGDSSTITASSQSTVTTVNVTGKKNKIQGSGIVKTVNIKGNNNTISTGGTKVIVDKKATGTTITKLDGTTTTLKGGTTVTTEDKELMSLSLASVKVTLNHTKKTGSVVIPASKNKAVGVSFTTKSGLTAKVDGSTLTSKTKLISPNSLKLDLYEKSTKKTTYTIQVTYTVANQEDFFAVMALSDKMRDTSYNFKMLNDVVITKSYTPAQYFQGVFDGAGNILSGLDNTQKGYCFAETTKGTTTIKNLNIVAGTKKSDTVLPFVEIAGGTSFTFFRVDIEEGRVDFTKSQNNESAYMSQSAANVTRFIECTNKLSYVGETGYTSPFLGGYVLDVDGASSTLLFQDCVNEGDVYVPYASLFIGNGHQMKNCNVTIKNCTNNGNIVGTLSAKLVAAIGAGSLKNAETLNQTKVAGTGTVVVSDKKNLSATLDENGQVVITPVGDKEEDYIYTVSYEGYGILEDFYGPIGTLYTAIPQEFTSSQIKDGVIMTGVGNAKIMDKDTALALDVIDAATEGWKPFTGFYDGCNYLVVEDISTEHPYDRIYVVDYDGFLYGDNNISTEGRAIRVNMQEEANIVVYVRDRAGNPIGATKVEISK